MYTCLKVSSSLQPSIVLTLLSMLCFRLGPRTGLCRGITCSPLKGMDPLKATMAHTLHLAGQPHLAIDAVLHDQALLDAQLVDKGDKAKAAGGAIQLAQDLHSSAE